MLIYSLLLMTVAIGDLALFLISVIRILIPHCDTQSMYYNEYAFHQCSYRVWFAGEKVVMVTVNQPVSFQLYSCQCSCY